MLKAICKNNEEHNRFYTVAHIAQTWLVNEAGEFQNSLNDGEVTHGPNKDNIWTCAECGEYATLKEV